MTTPMDDLVALFDEHYGSRDLLLAGVAALFAETRVELTIAKAEIEVLAHDRDATRRYLGIRLSEDDEDFVDGSPQGRLRGEVARILRSVGEDKKIQCIKELRASVIAGQAWVALGNAPAGSASGMGLKEAKDVIDAACVGQLYLGVKGHVKL